MAGNVSSLEATDTLILNTEASNTSSPLTNTLRNLAVSVAGSVLIFTGQDVQAADLTAQVAAAKEACVADAREGRKNLVELIGKKRAAGELDKVAKLETRFNDDMARDSALCEKIAQDKAQIAQSDQRIAQSDQRIAQADEKIAQDKAQIAQLQKLWELRKKIDAEIQKRLSVVDRFNEGDINQANSQIASVNTGLKEFLERVGEYIAFARTVYAPGDPNLVVIRDMEINIAKIASASSNKKSS